METKLVHIKKKIDAIQVGLLRFRDKDDNITFHVNAKSCENNSVNCVIADNTDLSRLVNKNVNLVQKSENDYLYISGQVKEKTGKNKNILSFRIVRACWFTKKSRGNLSWLQEKYIYDILPDRELELAS